MTTSKITTTINIEANFTADVSKKNDVYNIDKTRLPAGCKIGAVSWFTRSSDHAADVRRVFSFVCGTLLEKIPDYDIWLLIGDSAWQEDNRIARYKKKKEGAKWFGLEAKEESNLKEYAIVDKSLVKHFLTARLSDIIFQSAAASFYEWKCVYLMVVPIATKLDAIMDFHWSGANIGPFDEDLMRLAGLERGILIKSFHGFSDSECGFVGIGCYDLIKGLA